MNELLIGLLSAFMAANQPAAVSPPAKEKTPLSASATDTNDTVEKEYRRILEEDDAAQAEVDQWIRQRQTSPDADSAVERALLNSKIEQRFDRVRKDYEAFLFQHPDHARAHLAYGSFLSDIQEDVAASMEWEKARQLDPKNPAIWNNLANYYGHNGPVTNAFDYYAKAIELNPAEPIYYQNLATTVFLFRQDATNHFRITEKQAIDKAMALYRKALALDPDNFQVATELAQTYYLIKAPPSGDREADRKAELEQAQTALAAWQYAFKLARDDLERQGVLIHFARIQINTGRFEEARRTLNSVTNAMFSGVKGTLMKKLERRAVPPAPENTSPQP
jgi:tetratricopeptide (TPR) repeat protein